MGITTVVNSLKSYTAVKMNEIQLCATTYECMNSESMHMNLRILMLNKGGGYSKIYAV